MRASAFARVAEHPAPGKTTQPLERLLPLEDRSSSSFFGELASSQASSVPASVFTRDATHQAPGGQPCRSTRSTRSKYDRLAAKEFVTSCALESALQHFLTSLRLTHRPFPTATHFCLEECSLTTEQILALEVLHAGKQTSAWPWPWAR